MDPTEVIPESNDKIVRRKVNRAQREGVTIHEVEPGHMEDALMQEISQRCKDWAQGRKGVQTHLTGVRPCDDPAHRKFYYARDKDQKVSFALRSFHCVCERQLTEWDS